MYEFLVKRTRLPIEKFFTNSFKKRQFQEAPLVDSWMEMSFSPDDAKTSLGALTDARVYHNDFEKDAGLCLSVSSYQDEVEIYFFAEICLTDEELVKYNKGGFGLKTPAQALSDDLKNVRSALPQKLSVVDVIPEEHDEGFSSFYLLQEEESLSLHWADLEQGLVRKQTHALLSSDEYERILNTLLIATKAGEEKNALDLLNLLLPKMEGYFENHGYELAASATDAASDKNIVYFQIHCGIQSGHKIKRFNLLKEGLPLYKKHFPAIPDMVIEKMAACIDKYRDAYVQRRVQLANDLVADKVATVASLMKTMNEKKAGGIRGLSTRYLFEVAQWIHALDGLEAAKRLCEFILEYKNHNIDIYGMTSDARKMIVAILMDDRYPDPDKGVNMRKACEYLLEVAASSHNQDDVTVALNLLSEFSGFSYSTHRAEKPSSHFELPLILHQAQLLRSQGEELRQLKERVKQLESLPVQTPLRLSQTSSPKDELATKFHFFIPNRLA